MTELDHRSLYRLPWNLSDNPIVWLEPTQQCNLACDGCYRKNVKTHKPVDEVVAELETFARLRNFDGVSIAGGDPLCHPDVVEIVRRVTWMGRAAFHNLLAKLRLDSTRVSDNFMSLPGVPPVSSEKRSASEP